MQSKMEKLSNVNFTMTNGNVYEPPQGEMEEKLAAIWSELLGIECISRRDNFFALGGHSLLIVRMLTQLRQAGLDTCFGKVFGTPNLAALAKTVVHYKTPGIPSNLITKDSTMITPDMLPLIDLTQQEIDELVAQVPGGIANIQDIYGLAPSQQAILSNHITAKHGDPYLLVNCLEFIDRSALERYAAALQHVIERRDILRTVFIWKGLSEPAQVVLHRVPSLLAEVSLDDTDETVQEKLKNRFSPRHYRLDLRQAPPMQLFVAPTSEGGWTAIQLMHQIIGDHSTVQRLYSEVQTIINGENEQLATPTPFRHVVAQARLGVSQAEHNQFFSGMLADIDTPTLAFGLNDIQLDGTNIDEANLKIPQALNNQLRMHARHFRVSLASLCHLAWAQVLAHTNGNENIVFGTVLLQQFYSGKENDSAMEILTNTLPFRLDIDDTAVDDVVRNVHSRLSALLTHEHASLALAQRCSGVPAGLPLFNALLNYRHNFQTENITELSASEAQTIHPLTMSVDDNKEALYLTAQVMSPISAVRICAYMQQALISLVDALADTPHQPVRALTVMPSEEREMLLHIWNQTNVNYPSDRCLHQLFEAQVERDGRAIAVKCGDESLSYEELNVQSNRLAHFLIAQGVKPDDPVALCVKRSTKLLVAILGILKAGGAYVPLDPAYPSQRLTNILVDADPRCLLVDCIGKKALVDHEVPVLDLDEALPDNLSTCNADPAKLGLTSAHLVYIVYTSGTTGVPKGVLVEHRQVTNYLYWCKETFATEDFQHTLFSTSVGFDPSVFQSFAPLSMGKTTHIVANPLAITKIPLNFSLLDTVPSVVNVILNASTLPFSLRTLSVVGEPLNARLINRIFTHTKITKLYNLYGSTESTYATFHLYKPGDHVFETIGRPISNSRIYLLDAHGQLVPFGAEGELYIGGAVIARGYLNRPELTAERFLPDPFSENPSAQMFRTGDRARYLPDGNLVYLGRIDHQMNIRGFRVEPGEIEALLVEHPLVRDAIVQAWTDGPEANVRLIAYVVADSNISLAQNLRTYLTNILPDYMVPAAYVCLSSLPITANGKLDRSALPPPSDEAFARQSYEAPQGEIEEKLELIWSELLSIERISRNDNFFELGGHSLLIVRMLTQLRQLGLEATVQEVFGNPSLAALAKIIGKYQKIIIPPNMISKNCKKITPDMLPLIDLTQTEINALVEQVPGGLVNIQDIYGLAPLQEGILFHHMIAERGDPYLQLFRLQFENKIALDRYAAALQQVIERHDILRTVFVWKGISEPAQVVLRQVPSLLTEVTLDDTDDHVLEQLNDQFNPHHYRLDLKQAPLLRLLAAPTSKGNWIALQLMHHIIGDLSTVQRLHAEVRAIFDGKGDKLAKPIPFRHVLAQARLGVSQSEHTRFFSEMLADIDTPTLPFNLSNVHDGWTDIDEVRLKLSQELNNQLRALARHLRVNLASLCHLAWAQVLARASGSELVVFGTVLLGRLQSGEGNESVMGMLINTLPLRLDIDDTTVENSVRNAHSRLSALLSHEYASLALAQRCSGVPSSLPLFNALLNYRHKSQTEQIIEPPAGVNILSDEGRTNYPINLAVDDDDNTLTLIAYVASPLSAARISGYMQQALVSLVDALINTPQKPVRTLAVMPPEEREMLLHSWNRTTVNYPPVCCVHQLFEAQVERNGEAIAVEFEGETLSYAELNARANRLAHHLIARGVKPDDLIALCVKRSTKMIVAILGILKAGAANVPLDPIYSSQRLQNILEDADPLYLLTDATGQETLGVHDVPVINLDQPLPDSLSTQNSDARQLGLNPKHLAYIIYTSGSTGTPKGVMVEHQSLFNLAHTQTSIFGITPKSRILQFASCSFDVSMDELMRALTNGACLCIPNDEVRKTDASLIKYMITEKITHATLPPALFRNTKMLTNLKEIQALELVGEIPSLSLLQTAANQTKVFNGYGPTETTNCATNWICPVNFDSPSIPIGRPISNVRVYLLDSRGEPVPLGAEGELYIGGAGVTRGYLKRPELTAERFLSDPFSENPTARMYRTGDLARYLPDGNLVYLGRTDQQVKIRSFRIEPGEIEARLIEHPSVREAVVQPWKDGPDINTRLVAFVVADPDASLAQNLRTYLVSLLPHYMVPAAFVCLSSLPLTPNGKLDRQALPAPDVEAFARQLYEEPRGEMEEKLAAIWSELLGIEQISRNDNFFALGGHSLLIVKMLSQLRQIELDTNVREVFDAPSLAVLAETLSHYTAIRTPPNLITVESTVITPEMLPLIDLSQTEIDVLVKQMPGGIANIQDIYGLASLQQGILFHHLMAEQGDPYLIMGNLQFNDRATLDNYAIALQQVIERHDILRTAFIWEGLSEPAQVVLRQVPSLLTDVMLDDTDDHVLDQLNCRFNPRHYRLDLKQAPLMRLLAAPTSKGDWIVLQLMHHIIGDHTTQERLNIEVKAIIDGQSEKLTTPTPFRHLVAQARLGVSQAEHTKFFEDMLADVDTPTLPFGLSDVHDDGTRIDEMHLKLPQELNNQLRAHARHLHVSLASLFHLAWAQVLAKASGHKTVVFGTVLFGRLHSGENDSTMGLLINTLPIRLDIDERTVESAVRHTHSRLSSLLAHEHASLALAQRCSGVSEQLSLFNALLNYRHKQPSMEVTTSIDGVTFLGAEGRTNYPITLSVDDDNEALYLTSQVFSPISASRICSYMQQALFTLADALTNAPEKPVQTLTVIPQEEREMLLYSWNETTVNYPSVCCLHQLFEAQVERDGRSIAVECEGETMNYAELNAQANQLAHYLIANGVKPDDRIALCVKRSTKMIIAILGILKAGAAYVPLDPAYSSQRINYMLHDANPLCVLTDSNGQKALGTHHVSEVNLDQPLPDGLLENSPDPVKFGLNSGHLAYVIYTSGSTGRPKGVMIEHQSLLNLVHSQISIYEITHRSRLLQFASCSFDTSILEISMALTSGACLCIPNDEDRQTDTFLTGYMNAEKITHALLPPALFQDTQNLSDLTNLEVLIFGGETPSLSLLQTASNHTKVYNGYGPTETTIAVTTWSFSDNFTFHSIPIGRPIANTQIYLLDSQGEPVPLGAEGELYIAGVGVARGYLNQPEHTAERFIPDPFSENTVARMYRTGDQARYLPDGNLVYMGRTDQQIKIRGFRIEPSEIEARLVEHPLVRKAVVQLWKNKPNTDAQLVAYVVADPVDPSLAQNLRTYLLSLLPDYMVPAAFVCLSSLPITPNGKLDRRALPTPDDEAFVRQLYEAPNGEMEVKLAAIWNELLGIERISRNDNFFALGGHSLLIVRMLAKLQKAGIDSSVKKIFDTPSLAALAKTLVKHQSFSIPANLINVDTTKITPDMLPLISLSQSEIDLLVAQVPGGISNIQDIYGLAPLQEGILFHHMMAERGDSYLLVSRLHFSDREALKRYAAALQQAIERHDIYRTAFIWEGLSEPAQIVLRRVPSILTEVTLDETNEPVLEQLNNRYNPRHYKLDLTQAPLLRVFAAQTSKGDWMAVILMHHLIDDNTTLKRLNAEIHAIIDGECDQLTTPTPFRHVVAQARFGVGQAEHTQFFEGILADVDTPTLPFGLSDVHGNGTSIDEMHLKLPHELSNQLREHARHLHVSLASLCHLAWAQVLAKASGHKIVVFGTVLFGRLHSGENESTMGLLINTLPIRLDIDERTVESAVRHTHSRLSALLEHEHASLALAQRCSGVPATLPLFNALLNYRHNQPSMEVSTSMHGVTFLGAEGRTNYPINLSVDDDSDALALTAQVLSPISAARICGYMQQALISLADALANTPEKSVRSLTVMTLEERKMLLHSWNQTTINYSPVRCIHELFEKQVERDGRAIAVECEGEALSYQELNKQSNQLAHYLIARGVRPDDCIAVCVKRSTKMLVALLGILKSGGAYVPLDPIYSSQRLTHILQDAKPLCLLADSTIPKALGVHHQVPIVDLDEPLPDVFSFKNTDPDKLGLTLAHLAYVIYTSGSTGIPKGVMVEHQSVINLGCAVSSLLGVTYTSRVMLFASCAFDASMGDIVMALTSGARLCLPNEETRQKDVSLLSYIRTKNISHSTITPALFAKTQNLADLRGMQTLSFGGETPSLSLLKNATIHTNVVNVYGPTETTITATTWQCPVDFLNYSIPIGRPLSNTQIYLLDAQGEPVPLGAEGELYIGGAGVARGYLNRPELTADRFLPDPFNEYPTARMYRTGDLARYLPDGNLVYLGRTDQQVKIRGFRIEPGEIEARLTEHPLVREAVVQPWKNGIDTRLIAYVVADPNASLANNLRTYLASLLPDYMVPAAYVCLSSLPLTPNCKLDKHALPSPEDEAFARQLYESPQGEVEEKVALIWSELLGIERISRNDNFFELGGHSLLVMRFTNLIKKLYDISVSPQAIFSFPILKDLSEKITNSYDNMYSDVAIPARRYGDQAPIFLLPSGDGNISYGFEFAHEIDKKVPVYVLPWSPPEKEQPSSIEEMANTMISLIKKVQPNGPCAVAGYSSGGILAYEIANQLIKSGYPVSFTGLIDTYPPCVSIPYNETEMFLTFIARKFPFFKSLNDTKWWERVLKLSLNEAIDEVKQKNVDLKNEDIDWEVLLLKQRIHYKTICELYNINPISTTVNLFKATEIGRSLIGNEYLDKCLQKYSNSALECFNCPKNGWEMYNLPNLHVTPINCNHTTIIADARNRNLLGRLVTQSLLSCDTCIN